VVEIVEIGKAGAVGLLVGGKLKCVCGGCSYIWELIH